MRTFLKQAVQDKQVKKVLFLFLLTLTTKVALCQHVTLNDSIDSFGGQVALLLERTNNVEALGIGQGFNALWPSSFSTQQQAQIIDLAVRLQQKKYPSVPYHRDFFGALTFGVNLSGLSGTKLDNFLNMLSQSFERSTSRNFARELVNLRTFFEHEALHFTRYNSLYVSNADYDFEFIEAVTLSYEDIIIEDAEDAEDDVEEEATEIGRAHV